MDSADVWWCYPLSLYGWFDFADFCEGLGKYLSKQVLGPLLMRTSLIFSLGPSQGTRNRDEEGICVSMETLRKLMIQEGLWKAKRRKREKIFQRRARKSKEGKLVQVDGSFHNWFEDRGPPNCCLNPICR